MGLTKGGKIAGFSQNDVVSVICESPTERLIAGLVREIEAASRMECEQPSSRTYPERYNGNSAMALDLRFAWMPLYYEQ